MDTMTSRKPLLRFGDPETEAALRRSFGMPCPAPERNLEDIATGLHDTLTPAEREQFRLIWARLCATG
jgi:hypothetical protein